MYIFTKKCKNFTPNTPYKPLLTKNNTFLPSSLLFFITNECFHPNSFILQLLIYSNVLKYHNIEIICILKCKVLEKKNRKIFSLFSSIFHGKRMANLIVGGLGYWYHYIFAIRVFFLSFRMIGNKWKYMPIKLIIYFVPFITTNIKLLLNSN